MNIDPQLASSLAFDGLKTEICQHEKATGAIDHASSHAVRSLDRTRLPSAAAGVLRTCPRARPARLPDGLAAPLDKLLDGAGVRRGVGTGPVCQPVGADPGAGDLDPEGYGPAVQHRRPIVPGVDSCQSTLYPLGKYMYIIWTRYVYAV
jgi:hypothetical protein